MRYLLLTKTLCNISVSSSSCLLANNCSWMTWNVIILPDTNFPNESLGILIVNITLFEIEKFSFVAKKNWDTYRLQLRGQHNKICNFTLAKKTWCFTHKDRLLRDFEAASTSNQFNGLINICGEKRLCRSLTHSVAYVKFFYWLSLASLFMRRRL